MADILTTAFREGKIDKFQYDTYILFEGNDIGRAYLKNMLDAIVLEEPMGGRGTDYAKAEGRRSAWRQIKLVINEVTSILEGKQDVTNGNDNSYRDYDPTSEPIRVFNPPNFS